MLDVDITIIGAGVVGLALARELGPLGETVVLEQDIAPGRGISSRSSEVIHAGIYFPPAFLKTRLCVEGGRLLYEFCHRYQVPHRRLGKVIVATSATEEDSLERLCAQGRENGAEGLRHITRAELTDLEPSVSGVSAVVSPQTGIIDSHRLMQRLEALALDAGGKILCRTTLDGLERTRDGFLCRACQNGEAYVFSSRIVINAAGLQSDRIAAMAGIDTCAAGYRIFPVKGEYFRVPARQAALIHGLVYPSPEKDLVGLGIHATKDLDGGMRLGPNTVPVDTLDYDVDPDHRRAFFEAVHDLLPFLAEDDLTPDTAGIRPKIQAPGEPARDFVITHESDRDLPGLINLVGIESPGLTACLAIGRFVAGMLQEAGLVRS